MFHSYAYLSSYVFTFILRLLPISAVNLCWFLPVWLILRLLPIFPSDLITSCPLWLHANPETLSPISAFDYHSILSTWSLAVHFRLKMFPSAYIQRFPRSLASFCCSVSEALLSWSIFLRILNLSSFSAAVSTARWARSLSLIIIRWSLRSLAVGRLHVW